MHNGQTSACCLTEDLPEQLVGYPEQTFEYLIAGLLVAEFQPEYRSAS